MRLLCIGVTGNYRWPGGGGRERGFAGGYANVISGLGALFKTLFFNLATRGGTSDQLSSTGQVKGAKLKERYGTTGIMLALIHYMGGVHSL